MMINLKMIRGSQGWTPSLSYWNILERKIHLRRTRGKVFPAVPQLTVLGPSLPPVWHQTVRARWTTGYQSSHLSTSLSVRWCCRANLYKVNFLMSDSERNCLLYFCPAGLNKLSAYKDQVYQDIKIIQDNAREVTKSFAELCRYKYPALHHTTHHTRL